MKNTFIGSPIPRREDLRFLRGRGTYVDDLAPADLVHAVILRSPVAHGRLVSIDAAAALARPGVHAVITAKDLPVPMPIIPMRLQPLPQFKPFEQPVIAADKVRYVGEPIAVVLADVRLPDIRGPELGQKIRELEPSARIVFMSGVAWSCRNMFSARPVIT